MQEPTHILTGVVIQKSFERQKNRPLALILTAVLAFLSHGFLDELARVTYHPANPNFRSPLWVGFHSVVLVTTIVFLVLWWKRYKWGIIFAALPDIDWVFIHGQQIFHFQIPFYQRPHLHDLLHYVYHKIPPFTYVTKLLDRLPYNRKDPLACLWEVLLVAVLLLVFWLLKSKRKPASA